VSGVIGRYAVVALIVMLPLQARMVRAAVPAPAPEASIESCSVDIKKISDRAVRLGYGFKLISVSGGGLCTLDQIDLSFVVSATTQNDTVCEFELFTPPSGKQFNALRIGIKSGAGSAIRFIQKNQVQGKGFIFFLDASKGSTRQFRVIEIDVPPFANECSDNILQGAVP
jgi:hypothetical protein